MAIAGVESDAILAALKDVALSSGSACSSSGAEPSHVLAALGLEKDLVRGALRFGIGRSNTREEIDRVGEQVIQQVHELRAKRSGATEGRRDPPA